jgi:hypothetical protein
MLPHHTHDPAFSPHRAFVIQFHAAADIGAGHIIGRVEHVVSGQATRFESLHALLAFMARVLGTIGTPSQDSARHKGRADDSPRTP